MIGSGAVIGPRAIVEDRLWSGPASLSAASWDPGDLRGESHSGGKFDQCRHDLLINWKTDSCLRVPDAFCSRRSRRARSAARAPPPPVGFWLSSLWLYPRVGGRRRPALLPLAERTGLASRRLGIRSIAGAASLLGATFSYTEFPGLRGWARRWPQLWSIVRGDLAWIGNRPLAPAEALRLANDFERLGLTAPVGLISLADAEGCPASQVDDVRAHASFYAAT